jgi:hypothetical protein
MDPLFLLIINFFFFVILGMFLRVLWIRSKNHEKKLEEIYDWHKSVNKYIQELKEKKS